jgi:hypothetical protein
MKRLAAYGGCIAVLVGVFVLYTRPTVMTSIADMVWACFQ